MSETTRSRRLFLVLLCVLSLATGIVLGFRDPGRFTLSAKPSEIDWPATVQEWFKLKFGLVRDSGGIQPDRFLIYSDHYPGMLRTCNPRRGLEEGYLVRLGDREELTARLGEDFERKFVRRDGGLACNEVLLFEPGDARRTPAVVARPGQFYFVHRIYGPRSTKIGQEEFAVAEVISRDIPERALTLRRYPVE